MNEKKSSLNISIRRSDESIILSLSVTLRARQRIKMGFLRKNISEYIDAIVSNPNADDCYIPTTEILKRKTNEYRALVKKNSHLYLEYLNKASKAWIVGKSKIPNIFMPIETITFNEATYEINFPKELDFDSGHLNYFSFSILKLPPSECLKWARLSFKQDLIFCEIKTHPYMIDWDELAKFNLYEVGLNGDNLEDREALPIGLSLV